MLSKDALLTIVPFSSRQGLSLPIALYNWDHSAWEQVEATINQDQPIEFSFDMTDAKGGPVCGSLNLYSDSDL